jgi:tetratricopeptide (TPR) repeat protein
LGVVAHQVGKHEVAIDYIGRAIGLNGTEAAFHGSLGEAYRAMRRLPEAVACYRRAVELKPDFAGVYNNLGIAFKDQGKLDDAIACFRRVLQLRPNDAQTHHNLGHALKEQRKLDEAVASYVRALELTPDNVDTCYNLGEAFQGQDKLDEAVACYRRALQLKPDFVEAHNNLGLVLQQRANPDEAIACYRRALELKPDYFEASYNLGNVFQHQGKLDDAVACYRRALELKPEFVEAHNNLGSILNEQGKLDEAVACFRRVLEIKPDFAEAHSSLGNALHEQGKLEEAAVCHHRALELNPDFAEAHSNLGAVLQDWDKLDDAVACYRRALELKPDYAQAQSNLGTAFMYQGKLDEALACYRRTLELSPDFADAHWGRAFTWLLTGNWQHGWPEYEWRWQMKGATPRRLPQPLWSGEPLTGRTILLHVEQGIGDTIQFIRYASIIKPQGAAVVLECPKPLIALLEGCPGVDQFVGQREDLPAFDVHTPLLSVPGILKTSPETVPAKIPYLFPRPALVEQWRERLIEIDGFKVGISWQGNPKYRGDRSRSIPLRRFAPLAQIPGVCLISLQKGVGTDQLAEVRNLFPVTDLAAELDEQSGPFMDTAAVMKNLDLVITSDTASAHLAGALGVPVWVALSFVPDWRWLLDRSDSPWYPTMQLFRQKERGNWQGVFEEIKNALCQRLASPRADGLDRPGRRHA